MQIAMYSYFDSMLIEKGIEKTAEYAKKLNFSGVELLSSTSTMLQDSIPNATIARKVRKVLDDYDLPMVCYSVGCDTTEHDTVQKMYKKIDIAKELGSPYVHHTLILGSPGKEKPANATELNEKIAIAVDAAEKIAKYAESLGIVCIYEDQGYYVNGVKQFGLFYNEIKKRCKNVGVCADFGNIMFMDEKPEDFLTEYAEDVKHVHVKDFLYKKTNVNPGMYWRNIADSTWLRHTMIGHGVINYPACMQILKENGYNGAISLEISHPEPYENGVQQAMEYLRHFY